MKRLVWALGMVLFLSGLVSAEEVAFPGYAQVGDYVVKVGGGRGASINIFYKDVQLIRSSDGGFIDNCLDKEGANSIIKSEDIEEGKARRITIIRQRATDLIEAKTTLTVRETGITLEYYINHKKKIPEEAIPEFKLGSEPYKHKGIACYYYLHFPHSLLLGKKVTIIESAGEDKVKMTEAKMSEDSVNPGFSEKNTLIEERKEIGQGIPANYALIIHADKDFDIVIGGEDEAKRKKDGIEHWALRDLKWGQQRVLFFGMRTWVPPQTEEYFKLVIKAVPAGY